jgi:hypothetical protein
VGFHDQVQIAQQVLDALGAWDFNLTLGMAEFHDHGEW